MSASAETPTVLPGANDGEKLHALESMPFKNQAVWLLNAEWAKLEGEAENVWRYVENCGELDLQHVGNALDELNAHRFLEMNQETLTVRAMRTALRESGAIGEKDRPKLVPLIHVLVFKYNVDWHRLVNASQGDNAAELAIAQQKLDAAKAAVAESQTRAAESKQAQAELEAALADVKREEDEYNGKINDATQRSEQGGVVSRNRAKNELAQLLAEDPLPLRRAKITLEAAVKRADRAVKAAEEALAAAQAALAEAEAYLEEVKSRGGSGEGSIWWMERELHEQRKYLPTSRGGVAK
jgi:chromosome segregation ATPase